MAQASSRGRPISWAWVFLMLAFFIVGGVGLIASSWVVFWIGSAGFVLVGLASLFTGILSDVH
ncbi:DUF4175 domain-containing protein [Motilibacter aurantiacus]|uniref:DUF4175 domain-containing protein n=1 Tax=Motilibacter aurantiacus TaxID=2714955 RepID=UPI00140BC00B|nr:DUF4175 domain-containing protein [Motilibacter aurantiacus]NHC43725.1 DUF4175 domain-containing protein [Motilibacter aurantiacus]